MDQHHSAGVRKNVMNGTRGRPNVAPGFVPSAFDADSALDHEQVLARRMQMTGKARSRVEPEQSRMLALPVPAQKLAGDAGHSPRLQIKRASVDCKFSRHGATSRGRSILISLFGLSHYRKRSVHVHA